MRCHFIQHGLRLVCVAASVLLMAAVLPVCAAHADPSAFVEGIEDLPLMPHLEQNSDGPTVFDTPYGSIVESAASGHVSDREVLDFIGQLSRSLGGTNKTKQASREIRNASR